MYPTPVFHHASITTALDHARTPRIGMARNPHLRCQSLRCAGGDFGPGVLDSQGFPLERRFQAINPNMIVSRQGFSAPAPTKTASLMRTVASLHRRGTASTTGFRDGPAAAPARQIGDSGTGLHLSSRTSPALTRTLTGKGQKVPRRSGRVFESCARQSASTSTPCHCPLRNSHTVDGIPFGGRPFRAPSTIRWRPRPGRILTCKGLRPIQLHIYFITQAPSGGEDFDSMASPAGIPNPDYAKPPARVSRLTKSSAASSSGP